MSVCGYVCVQDLGEASHMQSLSMCAQTTICTPHDTQSFLCEYVQKYHHLNMH